MFRFEKEEITVFKNYFGSQAENYATSKLNLRERESWTDRQDPSYICQVADEYMFWADKNMFCTQSKE